jgi:hypothetical protein
MDIFVKKNSKLGNIHIFNITPKKTCKPTKWCVKNCYASKGNHTFPVVVNSSKTRLAMSKQADFVERAKAELVKYVKSCTKKNIQAYVRIHASGDFYSTEYIDKWFDIVSSFPSVKFLAFTKRDDMKESILKLSSLDNMSMYESLDPSKKIGSIGIKQAGVDIPLESPFECTGSCVECNYRCWNSETNVLFHKH